MRIYDVPGDSSTIGIKDVNHSIISPIIEYLNEDDNILVARYTETHPELVDPAITIITKDGETAKDAALRAINYVQSFFSSVYENGYSEVRPARISSKRRTENVRRNSSVREVRESFNLPGDGEESYNLPGEGEESFNLPGDGEESYNLPGEGEESFNLPGEGKTD